MIYKDRFDGEHKYDLIENGENISVNKENVGLYVEKYVDWYLNISI